MNKKDKEIKKELENTGNLLLGMTAVSIIFYSAIIYILYKLIF